MQKLVWLGQYLRHQGVLIEVLDIEYFSIHFIVLMSSLINIRNKVLILKVHAPELAIVIRRLVENWRLITALNLLTINSSDLIWRNASRPEWRLAVRTEVIIVGCTWTLCFSEAMWWRRSKRFLLYDFASWQINFLSCEINIMQIIIGMGAWFFASVGILLIVVGLLVNTLAHTARMVTKVAAIVFLRLQYIIDRVILMEFDLMWFRAPLRCYFNIYFLDLAASIILFLREVKLPFGANIYVLRCLRFVWW